MKKKKFYIIITAIMLIMILFAGTTFADEVSDAKIINELLNSAVITSVSKELASTEETGKKIDYPVVIITDEMINSVKSNTGYTGSISVDNGKISLDGREYIPCLGSTWGDDVNSRDAFESDITGKNRNDIGGEGEWYADFFNAKITNEDIGNAYSRVTDKNLDIDSAHVITYVGAAYQDIAEAADVRWDGKVSFTRDGVGGTFYLKDSSGNLVLESSMSVEDGKVVKCVKSNSGVQKIPSIVGEEGGIQTISIETSEKEGERRYTFNCEDTGIYTVKLFDEYGTFVDGIKVYDTDGTEASITTANGLVGVGLQKNRQYYIVVPDNAQYSLEVECLMARDDIKLTGNEVGLVLDAKENNNTVGSTIENLAADFLMTIAKVLNWVISAALKRTLTMDNIVFNEFDEVKLSFFDTGLNGVSVTSNSSIVNALKDPINLCYGAFRRIAIIGYMIILIYVGINVLLNSTSANKKASYKNTLTYWVTGIAILFMYPFLMKYIILANDSIVAEIANNRTDIAKRLSQSTTVLVKDGDDEVDWLGTDFDKVVDYSKSYGKKDYMSTLGHIADSTRKIGYAIAFLVLTWQLVMMVIYYYKRVFVVAFLIIIFPIIALTFVIDKLNDGKSQALSAWTKEFSIAVFVQTFHAIVFVFIVNSIYATLTTSSADFILLIIASSFMFAGEDIMKQIFGGKGTTALGSVTQSAPKIAAAVALTTKVGRTAIHNTLGKDGLIRGTASQIRNLKKYGALKGFDDNGNPNFLKVAQRNYTTNAGIASLLPQTGKVTETMRVTAETVDTLNNIDNRSEYEISKALEKYNSLLKMRNTPGAMTEEERKHFDAVMKNSKVDFTQLENLQNGMITAGILASGNASTAQVRRHLRLVVDYAFPSGDDKNKKKQADKVYAATLMYMRNGGFENDDFKDRIQRDWDKKHEENRMFAGDIRFATKDLDTSDSVKIKVRGEADRIHQKLKREIKNYDQLSDSEKTRIKNFSASVAMASNAKTGVFSTDDLQGSVDVLKEDYGAYQNVIDRTISQNVKIDLVNKIIADGGYDRSKGIIEERTTELLKQYKDTYGDLATNDIDKFNERATAITTLEQIRSGEFSAFEAYKAVTTLDDGSELSASMIKLAGLQSDIDSLKYILARTIYEENPGPDQRNKFVGGNSAKYISERKEEYDEAYKWASKTIQTMETKASDDFHEANPVTSIYDIIMAAENGNNEKIDTIEDLFRNGGSDSRAGSAIIDRKADHARVSSIEFAKEAMKEDKIAGELFKKAKENPYEGYTYNGYTYDEISKMEGAAVAGIANNLGGILVESVAKPLAATVGAAVGMAVTDDGAPVEEIFTGVTAGLSIADKYGNGAVSKFTSYNSKQKELQEIEKKVKKRIKEDEVGKLEAMTAFEEKKNDINAGNSDLTLELRGANANMYVNAEGKLVADVHVMAINAEYVNVTERGVIPSGGWMPYQEMITYVFDDSNPSKQHDLYVYVKDASKKIRGARITNLSI